MIESEISIQRAKDNECSLFARIKAETYADDRMRTVPEPDQKPAWYDGEWYVGLGILNEAEAKRLMDQYDCYIIRWNQMPIGIFWVHEENVGSLTLEDYCILPKYQGRGFGTRILPMIEAMYPEVHVWELSTPKYCKRNCHLYEKAGYIQAGTCSEGTVVLFSKEICETPSV